MGLHCTRSGSAGKTRQQEGEGRSSQTDRTRGRPSGRARQRVRARGTGERSLPADSSPILQKAGHRQSREEQEEEGYRGSRTAPEPSRTRQPACMPHMSTTCLGGGGGEKNRLRRERA
eukprot:2040964-Pyramimonas_sp.AAC.1